MPVLIFDSSGFVFLVVLLLLLLLLLCFPVVQFYQIIPLVTSS